MRALKAYFIAAIILAGLCSCKDDSRNHMIVSGGETPTASVKASPSEATHYVFYEANPRCFAASSQLNAISARLDEIKALGTDILWIMPIYPLGTEKAFGSPYCIKDYKGVRSECGSLQDFKDLVSAAHSKGIKVMLDWVANHTAWDHPWITEHPEWYTKDGHGNIVYPETWTDVADLNFASAGLRAAMIDAMEFWVTECDVDGFRCDYAHGVPDDFWSAAITALRALKPGIVMLAESDYDRLFDDGFDVIFSRALKSGLVSLYNGSTKPSAFMIGSFSATVSKVPAGKTKLFFITNHDDASEISPVKQFPGENAALSAFALAAALDGSPLIYSSQEVGYNPQINFFNTTIINWSSNSSYTEKYKALMASLSELDRSKGFSSFVSDSAVWVVYDNGYLVVNTTANKVKLPYPSSLTEDDELLSLGAYGYKVVVR